MLLALARNLETVGPDSTTPRRAQLDLAVRAETALGKGAPDGARVVTPGELRCV